MKDLSILKVEADYIEINNFLTHIFYLFKKIDNCLYFGNLPIRKGKNTYLYFHNIFLTNNLLQDLILSVQFSFQSSNFISKFF